MFPVPAIVVCAGGNWVHPGSMPTPGFLRPRDILRAYSPPPATRQHALQVLRRAAWGKHTGKSLPMQVQKRFKKKSALQDSYDHHCNLLVTRTFEKCL